ncbi:MAG: radical SAM protein [Candidatus Omnitrophica bacterium]|nr:radical SAM protein [Candidatus Omnitrophota bacterium]
MPELKEVIISITNRCNYKCRMCDIPFQKSKELTTSQWQKVIRDAYLIGAETIVFSGGEPLLREDIFELISYVKNNSMNCCLTSNGYLIDEECASRLHNSGIDVVNISIEGPPQIHDYLRGRGTFDKAVFALENLRKYKIESTIATMVSRYNYKYLDYIVELAKEYKATTIKFQPFNRIFLSSNCSEGNFFISKREIKRMKDMTKKVTWLCNNYGITTNPRRYLEMMPLYLSRNHFDSSFICNTLWISCPINSQGEIYPCWVLTQKDKLIGNINQDSFLNIWNSQKHRSVVEKIKKDGCPGCMMSCYDENFGRDGLETRIVTNVKRLQKEGAFEYVRRILKRWGRRFKFYNSYRGSPRQAFNRLRGLFKKKKLHKTEIDKEEIDKALKEIALIKKIFEEEIRCLS